MRKNIWKIICAVACLAAICFLIYQMVLLVIRSEDTKKLIFSADYLTEEERAIMLSGFGGYVREGIAYGIGIITTSIIGVIILYSFNGGFAEKHITSFVANVQLKKEKLSVKKQEKEAQKREQRRIKLQNKLKKTQNQLNNVEAESSD